MPNAPRPEDAERRSRETKRRLFVEFGGDPGLFDSWYQDADVQILWGLNETSIPKKYRADRARYRARKIATEMAEIARRAQEYRARQQVRIDERRKSGH